VIFDPDIWRAAQLIVKRHGAGIAIVAAQGDLDGVVPFRNSGDLRLLIVASVVWVVIASVYGFYLQPANSQWMEASSEDRWRCVDRAQYTAAEMQVMGDRLIAEPKAREAKSPPAPDYSGNPVLSQKVHAFELCVADAEFDAQDADYRSQVGLRLAGILLPPFAFAAGLWMLTATIAWIRQGYSK